MARNTRATSNKRAREKAQQERNKEKHARRLENREHKGTKASGDAGGEDPDIAGIRPGPQPRPEWLEELDAEAKKDEEADDAEAAQ
jgi:hypothetical protein